MIFKGNLGSNPYPSARHVIMGCKYAAATSQHLATLAGMEMFWAGGNAVDAALAMAIALTVVEPTSNSIGSDAFALVWDGKLHGLNGSGKSPKELTIKHFNKLDEIPQLGWLPVTVPGAVSTWRSLWERWGRLPFEQLFSPAIRYAEDGFPISPETAQQWQDVEATFVLQTKPEFQPFKQLFFRNDRAPIAGEIWSSKLHAKTLREIASTGGESFYKGNLAKKISDFSANTGGLLTIDDLADHQSIWVEPISTTYHNLTIWEVPPNSQGIATLMALNILEGFDLTCYPRESSNSYHLQIESMKLAFADIHEHISDPEWMKLSNEQLLDKAYASNRRKQINKYAISAQTGFSTGGTVYLAAADQDIIVSFIQSNYDCFGSGILIPETGIALQNRGLCFTLQDGHPNQIEPSKRPFHTIIPAFLAQENQILGAFGVMGGHMQPQGHLQVIVNLMDYNMNPQAALDAPRWQFLSEKSVLLEKMVSESILLELRNRGHNISFADRQLFGKGQIILKKGGVFFAATDPRADGVALAG